MEPMETVAGLDQFTGRGAGTDAERRAAVWLARHLGSTGDDVTIETFWCRPNWAAAHAWHVGLAIAGSLVSVASPTAGIAILGVALVSVLVDAAAGVSPGRWLTHERASQNVIVGPPEPQGGPEPDVRLVLTANYDAARTGLAYSRYVRRATARLRCALHGVTPGWLGWLVIAILWLLAIAILRLEGHKSQAIGAIQLPPTVGLVLGFALLLELATAGWSPSAGDNGTGVALGVALAKALGSAPPRHLAVELVLTGAGDGGQTGLRRHLRSRRHVCRPANTVVLGLAACGAGNPRWWASDGALLPLRFAATLRRLAEGIARDEAYLHARAHRGRGATPALPARRARLPAMTIGCLDNLGLTLRSHQRTDEVGRIVPKSLDDALQFALLMVDATDAALADAAERPRPIPA
jgi:Peptidase family M28